jgi:hypothetical protein
MAAEMPKAAMDGGKRGDDGQIGVKGVWRMKVASADRRYPKPIPKKTAHGA